MKRIFFSILLLLAVFVSVKAQQFTQADKVRVEALLKEAAKQPRSTNWMIWFSAKFYGVPYVGKTLDNGQEEKLIVNLFELDCTTFVETVLALSKCAQQNKHTFSDYCYWLQQVRYADGKLSYTTRQHYFYYWMETNQRQGITKTIECSTAPFSAIHQPRIDYMSKHVGSYAMLKAHPEWLPEIKKMEQSISGRRFRYIPRSALKPTKANNNLLKKYIKDGDIIAIVTSIGGLDTSHIGIAHWKSDGLHLINASSVHKKVVDEPLLFYNYMLKHPKQQGIRVCRMQ